MKYTFRVLRTARVREPKKIESPPAHDVAPAELQ
jgi:hypothetical protein